MKLILFNITYADGRVESVHVDSERVLVGSAAHCEIRLPSDLCAPEHLVFEVIGDAIRFEERAYDPPVTLNGKPVSQSSVQPDSVIGIGGTLIRVSQTEITKDANIHRKKEQNKGAAVRMGAMAIVGVIVGVFALRGSDEAGSAPATVPALWGASVEACPVTSSDQARAMAIEKRIVADGKRERHPFYIAEGVESVVLYETVSACFRFAGDAKLADELRALSSDLRTQVEGEYRVHRLRLEHALAVGDTTTSAREVGTLRSLMAGKQGPYVEWLNAIARKLNSEKAPS